MLDKDYGVKKSRIGQDSQRKFNQCHLCLSVAKDPVSCLKGHIFCRDCIMNNLLAQKKTIAQNKQAFEKEKEREEIKDFLKKRKAEEAETTEFEKDALEMGALKKIKDVQKDFNIKMKYDIEDYEKLEKEQIISQMRNKKTLGFDNHEMKKEMIQTSFWVAESSKDRLELLEKTKKSIEEFKPKNQMICPGDNKHPIKLKDLFPLKFENNQFVCYASKKELKFQKVVALRTCGHVYSKDFFDKCVGGSMTCLCGKKFLEGDVIDIEPAKSAFCEHNSVEAKVYEPSFAV